MEQDSLNEGTGYVRKQFTASNRMRRVQEVNGQRICSHTWVGVDHTLEGDAPQVHNTAALSCCAPGGLSAISCRQRAHVN